MQSQVNLFSLKFDNNTLIVAAQDIVQLAKKRVKGLVLPVNVDQVVEISIKPELYRIYTNALRVYADGMPIVWLSKIIGDPITERVAGSDLTPEVCRLAASENIKIFLFGAAPDVAKSAVRVLTDKYPGLNIVGTYSPPFGFENNEREIASAVKRINETAPDILFVALGFPKQEIFADKYMQLLNVGPIIAIGATLDFISGKIRRAPTIMRSSGFEWLWRLVWEPRRLWRRYLVRGPRFFRIAIKQIARKGRV